MLPILVSRYGCNCKNNSLMFGIIFCFILKSISFNKYFSQAKCNASPLRLARPEILLASSSPIFFRHASMPALDKEPNTVVTDGYALPEGV